jgi:hypothetical protein
VKSENLRKRIEEWGGVSAKGLKGLVDVGNTASMPQRYVAADEYFNRLRFRPGPGHRDMDIIIIMVVCF